MYGERCNFIHKHAELQKEVRSGDSGWQSVKAEGRVQSRLLSLLNIFWASTCLIILSYYPFKISLKAHLLSVSNILFVRKLQVNKSTSKTVFYKIKSLMNKITTSIFLILFDIHPFIFLSLSSLLLFFLFLSQLHFHFSNCFLNLFIDYVSILFGLFVFLQILLTIY